MLRPERVSRARNEDSCKFLNSYSTLNPHRVSQRRPVDSARPVPESGAEAILDYRRPDLVEASRAVAPGGVDVYWETQREPDFDRAVALLADRGRMIVIAGREARPTFPLGPFYVKGCSLSGFAMFKADAHEQAAAAADINRWLAAGSLAVPIDRVLPLAATAEAHALQEASTVGRSAALAGKILIEPDT